MARIFHRSSKYGDYTLVGQYGTINQTYGGFFIDLVTNKYHGAIQADSTITGEVLAVTEITSDIQADVSPSGTIYGG